MHRRRFAPVRSHCLGWRATRRRPVEMSTLQYPVAIVVPSLRASSLRQCRRYEARRWRPTWGGFDPTILTQSTWQYKVKAVLDKTNTHCSTESTNVAADKNKCCVHATTSSAMDRKLFVLSGLRRPPSGAFAEWVPRLMPRFLRWPQSTHAARPPCQQSRSWARPAAWACV